MSVKFTKTGQGSEGNDESLLFEFLDHELPEKIELDFESDLVTTKYVGSLQSSQHNGIFLQPIEFEGEFFGDMIDKEGNLITAKERFDQLARLQGRVVKFWVEGIKQIVIIKKLKMTIENYASIKYNLTLQPHDLQVAIAPTNVEVFKQKAYILAETDTKAKDGVQKNIGEPDLNNNPLGNAPVAPQFNEDNITAKKDKEILDAQRLAAHSNIRVEMRELGEIRVNGSERHLSKSLSEHINYDKLSIRGSVDQLRELNKAEEDSINLQNQSVGKFKVQQ